MAIAEAPTPVVAAARPAAHGHVRAFPNRHRLSDHFPSLSFTIKTGGLPYFDLLLTTDPSLFDPANAGRRTPSTFYASHQDGGLGAARDGHASYLVPSAVIRGFAAATPKPSAIYYTVIAYEDRDAKGPVVALAPEDLMTNAPSVSLAPDFKGQTLARIMAVSSAKLRVVTDGGQPASGGKDTSVDDAGAGDGAYGLAPPPIVSAASAAGDYVLQRLTLASGPAPPKEPILPGQRRPSAAASAQGADYPTGQDAAPGYLGDDGQDGDDAADGEPYRLSAAQATQPGSRPAALAPEPVPDAPPTFRSLDDASTPAASAIAPAHALDATAKRKIILRIAREESGGDYAAINADGEFEGKFPGHPAIGKWHVGLSFGLIQFAQDSSLGELLVAMRDRDPQAFRDIFGDQSDELIRVTTSSGPPSSQASSGRSARVQPVGGADLWKEPWLSRFKRAGNHRPFQEVQEQLAIARYLDPMLQFSTWLGLDSERALTMVADRAVQLGVEGAKRWIIATVGPVSTPAVLQQALAALGHDLRGFQAATPGLVVDGVLGPMTHAAMVAALRKLGSASPIPVMTREQMLDALVRRSAADPWRARIDGLRNDAGLSDAPFQS